MIKVGINGFGRIGRLVARVAVQYPELRIARINDPGADAATIAHLLKYDSVHGRWEQDVSVENGALVIDAEGYGKNNPVALSSEREIVDTDWSGCDLVFEASGKMRKKALLEKFLEQGVRQVVVSAPVSDEGVLNIVIGVNDNLYDPESHKIITAASCTTNCLAVMVKVVQEEFGIRHAMLTTIHAATNDQSVLDAPHKDLRRARASSLSLIPTTTGSAKAIIGLFPELDGKIDGIAVRVPVYNASLTDCVFELESETTAEKVKQAFERAASEGPLKGVLAYEPAPLVSADFRTDPHSATIDADMTRVVDGTQLKVLAWYDNEWGYANRSAELVRLAAREMAELAGAPS